MAIVGLACAFPESPDVRAFWQNVLNGFDPVRDVPPDRWPADLLFADDPRAPDRTYAKRGAFLGRVRFDPLRYGIPPAVVGALEPLQLLALDVARRALEDAGCDGETFPRDRASVIIACSGIHDVGIGYAVRAMLPLYLRRDPDLAADTAERIVRNVRASLPQWSEDSFPGFLPNVIAGRIANRLDLRGGNHVVDAACASSLAAVHTAVHQLRAGSCDVVLVGAADWSNNAFAFMSFSKTWALTRGEHGRPFDAGADGIVLGEGVGAAVLKRLSDAERDGDRIVAVIRGVGASSDGRNRSLTAPHGASQALALRRAYADARVDPTTVELIEAHGTGTAVGDAVELGALADVFAGASRCAVGSVKSMVGHAKASAGFVGLVKAALAVRDGVLPPTLHVETPNPALAGAPGLYLNTETRPWIGAPGCPRRAGVSSFGFGGTNYHVVLESAPAGTPPPADLTPRPVEVFAWRRATRAGLREALERLQRAVTGAPSARLDELAHAVFVEESGSAGDVAGADGAVRLSLVVRSRGDLTDRLATALAALDGDGTVSDPRGVYLCEGAPLAASEVAFLFPGQGAQRVGMLRDLVQFGSLGGSGGASWLADADALLEDLLPARLSDYVFPPPTFTREEARARKAALEDTQIAQPAVGAMDVLASDVLERFGIRPAMAAGHSYGEYAALWRAGVYSREGLLRLSALRGRAVAECAERGAGGMIAVAADEATTRKALADLGLDLTIANLNAPRQTIVGGTDEAVAAALERLPGAGVPARRVAVSAAFHTALVQQASDSLRDHLRHLDMAPPRFPVFSNVTAAPYPGDVAGIRDVLHRHLASPVRFIEQIRAMHAAGARAFVEVGPGRILTGLVRRILADEDVAALALDDPGRPAWEPLGHLVAHLAALGLEVDLAPWFGTRPLSARDVDAYAEATRRADAGRPTDWWLEPTGSRPTVEPCAAPSAPSRAEDDVARELASLAAESRALAERQARLAERIADLQERLTGASSGPASASASALPVAPAPVLPTLPVVASAARAAPPTPVLPASIAPGPGAATRSSVVDTDGVPSVEKFRCDLLAEVSRRTGYPEEALELDLPLEAGLGIDSIKVMEVFSALERYHRILQDDEMSEEEILVRFAELRTLGAVIEHYAARRDAVLAAGALPKTNARVVAADVEAATDDEGPVDRLVLRSVPGAALADGAPAPFAFPEDQTLLVLGDVADVASAFLAALSQRGVRTFQVVPGKGMRADGEWRFEVDLTDPAAVAELGAAVRERSPGAIGGIVDLLPLSDAYSQANPVGLDGPLHLGRSLLNVAREFEDDVRGAANAGGGVVLNVTRLDGRFGMSGSQPLAPAQAASIGFFKALSREWTGVRFKILDIDPGTDVRALLAALASEVGAAGGPLEIGLDGEGRWRLDLVEEARNGNGGGVVLDGDSVVLALGGGRGITFATLERIAREAPVSFVIVGRSEQDAPGSAELRANLAALEALGAKVAYRALDVRDEGALTACVEEVYERLGRIDAVIHGAGVVEDRRLRDKTPESFARVFDTKVRPALVLARVLRPETLRFVAFFSSVSGRFGNVGQVDYCAANECLNKLAADLDRRWPAVRVVALNWGPWDAGMVPDHLRALYRRLGIRLMPQAAGTAAFLDELGRGHVNAPEVVLACDARELEARMSGGASP